MFKKFSKSENVKGATLLKSSVQRSIRSKVLELYPVIEQHIDCIFPKKCSLSLIKCDDKISIVSVDENLFFFCQHDGAFIPTLRLIHKYPNLLKRQQVDRGAIRFILSGANIMCPGLTSSGACLSDAQVGDIVSIYAEGKEHALAVGIMLMPTLEIKAKNKGVAVETLHYLNDGLWRFNL
ncbi:malignant T-cell-amplified sequence 1 homolog [Zophobas morio]|uniref:malignant T-cell-amplified sequence 1 homolog n=1 Tax=Zophobas morio TaxID=2755281 RepID=UPI003082E472